MTNIVGIDAYGQNVEGEYEGTVARGEIAYLLGNHDSNHPNAVLVSENP